MSENRLNPSKQNQIIQKAVKDSIENMFPIESGNRRIVLRNVYFEDNLSNTDFPAQKQVKLDRKSWDNPIKGDIEIQDISSGKVIDKKTNVNIGKIPKLTNRHSAIIRGNEYQIQNQLRRKAGIYSRQRRNGELESEFNLAKGANFSIEIDPEKQKFYIVFRGSTRKFHLWNLMDLLGVSESEIKQVWGPNLLDKNRKAALNNEQTELRAIHKRLLRPRGEVGFETILKQLKEYFNDTKMDGQVNEFTLGRGFEKVTGQALLEASKKLLRINKGEEEPDNRDSLVFKSLNSIEDQIVEYFEGNKSDIERKITNALTNRDKAREVLPANIFSKKLERFYTTTDLSSTPPQTNPAAIMANARKTTVMGEGGIQNQHAITEEVRDFNPSDIGFLDGLATPEGLKVGVNVNLASGVRKRGKELEAPVLLKNGKKAYKTPIEIKKSVVGLPDQKKMRKGKLVPISNEVKALKDGNIIVAKASDIDFYFNDSKDLFDYHSNTVPFLHNTQGNRGSTAGRMLTQALPLDDAEAPLVQTKRNNSETFEKYIGNSLNPTLSDETGNKTGGTVKKINDKYITIETDGGEEAKVGIFKDFPLNEDGYLNSTPIVEVGEKITANQPLTKNNYTDNEGTLAVGKNLLAAYLPYKGYSFEDGAVITEGASKKLSHTTIHKENIYIKPKLSVFNLKKFRAYFPDEVSPKNGRKLTEEGLPKVGETFDPGEIMAAFLIEKQMDDFDKALKRLDRSIYRPYRKYTLEWESEEPGVVQEVRKNGRNIDIYVKAVHPFKVGDKIANRFGGKNIITNIIPDDEAPHLEDGTPIEIMLNPNGVPGRMNTGQIHETAASRIAQKKGKPYVVENFADPNGNEAKRVVEELEKEGLEPNQTIIDGKTGKPIENKIFAGPQYFMKLRHLVKKKQGAHDFGVYDIEEQPANKTGAQKLGTLESYAYLAHGSKNLLREATTIKGQKNEEYFRDLQFGIPPGKPNRPYVFQKLQDYLRASGVDTEKKGNKFRIMPLTDERVLELSNGELKDPGSMLVGKNLTSRKDGLFDPKITGGALGTKYSHIALPKDIPNPMMEMAIRSILDLTKKDYQQVISGKEDLNGEKGPTAILNALADINIDEALEQAKADLEVAPKTNVNKLNRKVRFLSALKDLDLSADKAYKMRNFLVIPPKSRPAYPLPSGDLRVSDINKHYRDVGLISKNLKEAMDADILDEEDQINYEQDLYRTVKAAQGFIDPITYGKRKYKGALKELEDTKRGLIFGKAWAKRQDLSGRSTVTAEPSLGLDQIGIPKDIAIKTFKPFVVRDLKESGMPGSKALQEVNDFTPAAQKALERVMEKKHVVINRAPSLHKHSVQAFKPLITTGKDIKVNPLVVSGFNMDFDGDEQINSIITFLLDKHLKEYYFTDSKFNKNYWTSRKMSARFNTQLPYIKGGNYYIINLEDFPHLEDELIHDRGDAQFYKAAPHIKVLAYDEHKNKIVLTEATGWSKHLQKEIWTVSLSDGVQIITDDDPRAVYGMPKGSYVPDRFTPSEAKEKKVMVPRTRYTNFSSKHVSKTECRGWGKLNKTIPLNENVGYVIGSIIGDGWVDVIKGKPTKVNLSNTEPNCFKKYKNSLNDIFKSPPHIGHRISKDSYGKSEKRVISSVDFAEWILPLVGKGAKNKHLPPFWFSAPKEFKLGLISGLLDTDGSISVSGGKTKPQLMANISSISIRLLQECQQLLRTLGIHSKISYNKKTQAGNDFWILTISAPDISLAKDSLIIAHELNKEALDKTSVQQDSKSAMRQDYVPFNESLFNDIKKAIPSFHSKHRSLYVTLSRDSKKGRLTRYSAKKILELGVDLDSRWIDIVNNEDVTWAYIEEVTNTGKKEDGYDLTVPGYETFMSVDGVILSNTASVQVPVTKAGEEEAKAMRPSNILFKHGDGMLVPTISHEYAYGLAKISEKGKKTGKSFKSIDEAKEAELNFTDVFDLNGKEMTIGQWIINKPIPDPLKDYDKVYNKKEVGKLLSEIGKKYPNDFADVINNFKDIGAMYSYKRGMTMSITDLNIDRSFRDRMVADRLPGIQKIKDKTERIAGYEDLIRDLEKEQNKQIKSGNNIMDLLSTGALSGGKAQNVRQVLTAPGVLLDVKENPIDRPLLKSYAEGLDIADYLTAMPGVRKGIVNKSISTQESGALNKALLNVNRRLLIVEEDCNTEQGITMEVTDPNVLDRAALFSVRSILDRNEIIDGEAVQRLKKAKIETIKVRSPLTCESVEGICQLCYGLLPDGKLPSEGTNVGVLDSQAVSERSTQLSLSAFHTGGSTMGGSGNLGSFPRLEQLVKVPQNLSGKATLAPTSGKVDKVEKNDIGGYNIFMDKRKKPLVVAPSRKPLVRAGQKVKKGDRLSDGVIKPQELGDLTSHLGAQQYIVDELDSIFGGDFHKKTFETMITGISDNAEVIQAPEDSSFFRGDKTTASRLKKINKERRADGKEPIEFKSYFKSIDTLNTDNPDWMTRITTNRVKNALQTGAARADYANLAGKDPIPAYIYGEDFGKPDKKGGGDEGFF